MSDPGSPRTDGPVSAPAETDRRRRQITGLSCPSCSGALEVAEGLRTIVCPYCDTPLLAIGEIGVQRLAVRPEIAAAQAQEKVRRWWSQGFNKHRKLPTEAETAETFLCFLPFFRVQADVIGHAFGTERRTRSVGSGKRRRTETVEVDVERKAERHFDRTYPAVNVAEWGVQQADLAGDTLVAFDADRMERLGMVFAPTASERDIRQAALDSFKQEADPSRGLHRTRFLFLERVRERFSVIYYPLWVVRYRFQGRSYQAVIDAEDGAFSYGKAPGNDLYRALMAVGSVAVACFVGTTATQIIGDPIAMLAIIGGVSFTILAWGWKRFRHGGEVIEGKHKDAHKVARGTEKSPLAKLGIPDLGLDKLMRGRR